MRTEVVSLEPCLVAIVAKYARHREVAERAWWTIPSGKLFCATIRPNLLLTVSADQF